MTFFQTSNTRASLVAGRWLFLVFCFCAGASATALAADAPQVRLDSGVIAGRSLDEDGVALQTFQGIAYAAPPVGQLRWRPPKPVTPWRGTRRTAHFGPRCMQRPLFSDMVFRSRGMGEDCLYLNVWKPAAARGEKARLPVLVYFYGGGFVAGDGSELRYDGASLASKGIVTVTVNYRLGVFGFFALPALVKESPHHAAGNYGLLDQVAALRWVKSNIAAFGGDPARVTIAGESAGSISVSALMASPLARGLFSQAIGESGALIAPIAPVTLAKMEEKGKAFAHSLENGQGTLKSLRAMSAKALLQATRSRHGDADVDIDGWFLTEPPRPPSLPGVRRTCRCCWVPIRRKVSTPPSSSRSHRHRSTIAPRSNACSAGAPDVRWRSIPETTRPK